MFSLAPTGIYWFLKIHRAPGGPNANCWTPTPWSTKGLRLGSRRHFLLEGPIRKIRGWGAFCRYNDIITAQTWTVDVGSLTQGARRLHRLGLSLVPKRTNGRKATPTLGSPARRFLSGWRRGKHKAAVLV